MGCCLNQMIHHNLSPATSPFGPRNATLANVSVVFSFFENKPTNCQPNPRERMKTSWPSHLVLILFSVKGGPGRLVDQLGIHEYPGWFVKRFAMDILFGVPLPFSASKKVPRPATKMSILEQIRQIFRWEWIHHSNFSCVYGHVIVRNSPGKFRPIQTLNDLSDSIHLKSTLSSLSSITIWKCDKENHVFVLLPLVHLFNRVLVRFHWIIRFKIFVGKCLFCMMHMCQTKNVVCLKKKIGMASERHVVYRRTCSCQGV